MGEAVLVGDQLIEPCPWCDGHAVSVVTETIHHDRLVWAVSGSCNRCDYALEVDGSGDIVPIERAALIARVGLVRLRVDPDSAGGVRVALLAVLRKQGMTIAEATAAYATVVSEGLVGTPAEMQLLADKLARTGVAITRTPIA